MKIQIETKSTQIIDGKAQTMLFKGKGNLENFEKGSIITWDIPKENLSFKMTVLDNKILLKKENQNMIFSLGNTTKSSLKTAQGILDMEITTTHIEIAKQEEMIRRILLEYDINIEDIIKYQNKIEIVIK